MGFLSLRSCVCDCAFEVGDVGDATCKGVTMCVCVSINVSGDADEAQ